MLSYKSGLINCKSLPKLEAADLKRLTTYGLGGRAAAYFPENPLQAKNAYTAANGSGKKVYILGNGSNVLAADGTLDGVIISTKRLKGIVRHNGNTLLCLAGTTASELLCYCKRNGLGGLEYLYGIPCTIGGAAYMNAGIGGQMGSSISENIVSVKVFDGKTHIISRENCNFGYRRSTMRDINALILSIIVKVDKISAGEFDERIAYYRARRQGLPKGRSCGCVFKNPGGTSAGYLIEKCGLKGYSHGGARVSDRHANFIINSGNCAEDVRRLIADVKRIVFERTSVILEEEVVYIGF